MELLNYIETFDSAFRQSRNDLIESRIIFLKNGIKRTNKDPTLLVEVVDDHINQTRLAESEKICVNCNAANDIIYRNCQGKLIARDPSDNDFKEKFNPYVHFSCSLKQNLIKVVVGEPDAINPFGYENIATILRNLGKRSGIKKYCLGGEREWIYLEKTVAYISLLLN